jgi:hypothetical protein
MTLAVAILGLSGTVNGQNQGPSAGPDDPGSQRPADVALFGGGAYPGGYLKYSYKVTREGVAGHSITTTEIIPEENGMYRIEATSSDLLPEERVSVAFFGIGLRGLGFRVPTSIRGTVDLSPLSALEEELLEAGREYVLPDGGYLAAEEAGRIAGVDVVFAVYTHADYSNVSIRLAMPNDLMVRTLLPLFPYLELLYAAEDEGAEAPPMRTFSTIELIEFVYEP